MVDIYLITNLVNRKSYVGKAKNGYMKRFLYHCRAWKYPTHPVIDDAIHKYGKDNFRVELLKCVPDEDWVYWEQFYIKSLHTHYTEGGYNITWGGDVNPMDDDFVKARRKAACSTPEHRQLLSNYARGKKHTEQTKALCRQRTLQNLEVCIKGFREYNNKRKIPIAMLDDNDNVLKTFECAADACRYFGKNSKLACGKLLALCDHYNKNGKRSKFWGYCWKRL